MVVKAEEKKLDLLRFVSFSLREEYYGQDIRYIREVTRMGQIAEMPATHHYLLGVMNLRGMVVPVLDLGEKLGLEPMEVTPDTRLIIVEYSGSVIALLVDEVHQVMEIPRGDLHQSSISGNGERDWYLHGAGNVDQKIIFFLDVERIFMDDRAFFGDTSVPEQLGGKNEGQ